MRIFELSTRVKVIRRSKGHVATAAAAYRAGDKIKCARTGKTYDYSRRHGVAHAEIILPEGNGTISRQTLWNMAEAKETRKNSRTAREYMFSLPVELSPEGRHRAVRRTAQHLVNRHGVAVETCTYPGIGLHTSRFFARIKCVYQRVQVHIKCE